MGDTEFYSGTKKYQFLAAAVATLGAFGLGNVLSWPSPGILSLKNNADFGANLTKNEESLIGSIVPIGALASGFVTGALIGIIGRKITMLAMSIPFVIGWILIIFSSNLPMLYAGRFITGFCGGAFSLAAPVFIGEIAEASIRGVLGSAFQLMVVSGILFSYVVGSFLNYVWLSVCCAVVPIIFMGLMIFMPESPVFYLSKGKTVQATESLCWLRGTHSTTQIQPELQAMQKSIDKANREKASFKDLFRSAILRPVSICLFLMFFQQLSGINAVVFFTKTIFQDAGSDLDSDVASIIVGVVMLAATFASTFFIDRAGRTILLLVSDFFMGVSLVGLGIFFMMKNNDESSVSSLGWLPLTSMIIFVIAFSIGYGPIPWMMMGEILPPKVIGLASSIATSTNWFLAFMVTQFFAQLQESIGVHWCYWLFAIICFVGFGYVMLFVPETKGKSIDEIQALFGNNDSRNSYNTYDPEGGRQNQAYEEDK